MVITTFDIVNNTFYITWDMIIVAIAIFLVLKLVKKSVRFVISIVMTFIFLARFFGIAITPAELVNIGQSIVSTTGL